MSGKSQHQIYPIALCIGTQTSILTTVQLKMRSSGNPKSGVPVTGKIKIPLDGHSNSSGE